MQFKVLVKFSCMFFLLLNGSVKMNQMKKREVEPQFQKHVRNTYAGATCSVVPVSTICSGQGSVPCDGWGKLFWCLGDGEPGQKCLFGLRCNRLPKDLLL